MILADEWHPAWTFSVNVGIAASTLLAALVALYLGITARRDQRERDDSEEAAERRQIALVIQEGSQGRWLLEVVNGSSDLINNLIVEVYGPSDARWVPNGGLPLYISRLNTFGPVECYFRRVKADGTIDDNGWVGVERFQLRSLLAWTDAHGQWWARRDGGDPYKTDGAKPGRDTAAFVAGMPHWWQRAWHWLPNKRQRRQDRRGA